MSCVAIRHPTTMAVPIDLVEQPDRPTERQGLANRAYWSLFDMGSLPSCRCSCAYCLEPTHCQCAGPLFPGCPVPLTRVNHQRGAPCSQRVGLHETNLPRDVDVKQVYLLTRWTVQTAAGKLIHLANRCIWQTMQPPQLQISSYSKAIFCQSKAQQMQCKGMQCGCCRTSMTWHITLTILQ